MLHRIVPLPVGQAFRHMSLLGPTTISSTDKPFSYSRRKWSNVVNLPPGPWLVIEEKWYHIWDSVLEYVAGRSDTQWQMQPGTEEKPFQDCVMLMMTRSLGMGGVVRGAQAWRTKKMALCVALGLLIAVICLVVLCVTYGTLGRDIEVHEDQNNGTIMDSLKLASINTDFALSLYKELALKNPNKNIVFSPFSISAALAILSLGASSNTLEEILEGLKFSLTETPEADIHRGFGHLLHMLSHPGDQVKISIGSMMFIEKRLQILAEFKEKARVLYQAEVSTADFQQPHEAKKNINDYVSKQTQGKIKELISDLDVRTVMVLVNYIYFKGKWKTSFDPEDTFESEFHLGKRRSVKVPMMHIEDLTTPYFWDEDLSCSVVELKYTGNASALFILPDEGKMQQVEASLQPETLRKWEDSLRPRMIDDLYMPKFSISTDYSLEKILPQLGIREVFSKEADLSRITGTKDLRVSQVVHKAVLDVAETGTEAAAATGVKIIPDSGKLYPMTVNFNRPFLVIVSDTNTQTLIFMAKVTNPKEN